MLLADLLELDDRLDPLLRAAHLAMSRKHQVLLVCPWPPGIEPYRRDTAERKGTSEDKLGQDLRDATTRRYHDAYARVRRAFGRLGVPVVSAATDEPVRLVLERLNRLRAPGRNR